MEAHSSVAPCWAFRPVNRPRLLLLVFPRVSPPELMGVKSKINLGLMKMKLAELISVAAKLWEAFEVVDFESLGNLFGLYP